MNIGQVDHGNKINQQVKAGTDFLRTFATENGSEQELVTKKLSYCIQKDEIVMSVGSNICQGRGLKWNRHQAYPLVTSTLGSMKPCYVTFLLYNIHTPIFLSHKHIAILVDAIASHVDDQTKLLNHKNMMNILPNMRPIGITVGDAEASGEVGDTVCTAQVGGTKSTLATGPWEIHCNDLVSVYIQGWEESLYDEHGRSLGLLERFWDKFVLCDDNDAGVFDNQEQVYVQNGVGLWIFPIRGQDNGPIRLYMQKFELNEENDRRDLFVDAARLFCPYKYAMICLNKSGLITLTEEETQQGIPGNVYSTLLAVAENRENQPGAPHTVQMSQHTEQLRRFHDNGRLGMKGHHPPNQRDKRHLFGIKPYHQQDVWTPSFGDRNRIIGRAISSGKPYSQSDILISRTLI